jgi:hypothetical protein
LMLHLYDPYVDPAALPGFAGFFLPPSGGDSFVAALAGQGETVCLGGREHLLSRRQATDKPTAVKLSIECRSARSPRCALPMAEAVTQPREERRMHPTTRWSAGLKAEPKKRPRLP